MNTPRTRRAALVASTLFILAGVGIVVVEVTPTSDAAPTDAVSEQVQSAAQQAVVAWQTLFIEQQQLGALTPDLVQPIASALSSTQASDFVSHATAVASTLFDGHALQVLTDSLASEAQTSSPEAMAAAATGTADAPPAGVYTICVGGGASNFSFSNVSVSGSTASVDLTANAWTANVDFADGQLPQVDIAQGPGTYHLELDQSPSGQWMVSTFDATPDGQ